MLAKTIVQSYGHSVELEYTNNIKKIENRTKRQQKREAKTKNMLGCNCDRVKLIFIRFKSRKLHRF